MPVFSAEHTYITESARQAQETNVTIVPILQREKMEFRESLSHSPKVTELVGDRGNTYTQTAKHSGP